MNIRQHILPLLLCLLCTALSAQESCYEQYFRGQGKEILLATDENDDSYDELKKEVIARQVLRGETPYAQYIKDRYDQPATKVDVQSQVLHRPLVLAIDTVTGACHLLAEDGTILAEAHIAMVDSTWYMWLSVDPLADKYPGNTPYMYCLGNPIKNIDMRGDSVSFATVELFDKTNGTNVMENTISDLQSITGLFLSVSNGMLEYAKKEDGSAELSTNGSSATAREQLIALVSNNQTINVGICRKSGSVGNDIALSPTQINSFISGAHGVDGRTLGYGMTFLHESFHTNIGGGLKDNLNGRGLVVDKMNVIRAELNNVGYNFGQRMSYCAIPSHGRNYIPFSNTTLQVLGAGLSPCTETGQKYISY